MTLEIPADFLAPAEGWRGPVRARLPAPPPAARGLLFRQVSRLARMFGRSDVPDVITVLHLNPRLFWAWLFFASRLMPFGELPAPLREKLILRTAWNCRSRYEWGQHVDIALAAGVSDAEIVALAAGPAAVAAPLERVLLQACDELCRDQCVDEATWATLAAHYSEARLVEVLLLVGHYVMIAGFLNSAGLALEPPVEATLQAFHARLREAEQERIG